MRVRFGVAHLVPRKQYGVTTGGRSLDLDPELTAVASTEQVVRLICRYVKNLRPETGVALEGQCHGVSLDRLSALRGAAPSLRQAWQSTANQGLDELSIRLAIGG